MELQVISSFCAIDGITYVMSNIYGIWNIFNVFWDSTLYRDDENKKTLSKLQCLWSLSEQNRML